MQSSMFDSKSCCLTHPASIWRPIAVLAHARTLTPAPPSVLMMRPFQECPRDRRCGISRRGGRALRRRTVALRRDCSELACGAEAKGDRLGDLEETLAIQIGKRLGSHFRTASVLPSIPSIVLAGREFAGVYQVRRCPPTGTRGLG